MPLSESKKIAIAEMANKLVTSNAEDAEIETDPYSFLTFTHNSNSTLIGRSKQFSHKQI